MASVLRPVSFPTPFARNADPSPPQSNNQSSPLLPYVHPFHLPAISFRPILFADASMSSSGRCPIDGSKQHVTRREQSWLRLSGRPSPPNRKLSLSGRADEAETDARARGEMPFDRLQPIVGLLFSGQSV